jgi:hypothetical protein
MRRFASMTRPTGCEGISICVQGHMSKPEDLFKDIGGLSLGQLLELSKSNVYGDKEIEWVLNPRSVSDSGNDKYYVLLSSIEDQYVYVGCYIDQKDYKSMNHLKYGDCVTVKGKIKEIDFKTKQLSLYDCKFTPCICGVGSVSVLKTEKASAQSAYIIANGDNNVFSNKTHSAPLCRMEKILFRLRLLLVS